MDAVTAQITDEMKLHGYKFKTVSIKHLSEVQDAVGNLIQVGILDPQLSKNWQFYKDNNNKSLPGAKGIIIAAAPQTPSTLVFQLEGKEYPVNVPPGYLTREDVSGIGAILKNNLEPAGFHFVQARLALKTLAIRSGLARYGRNNVTYVARMGSYQSLTAFYTDYPVVQDNWQAPLMVNTCQSCSQCRDNCPAGCIPADRFLIHAERCLTFWNESEADFPDWIKPEWHNSIIGCSICQAVCPVNKPYQNVPESAAVFTEEETELILSSAPEDKLGAETRMKLGCLIEDGYLPMLGRNLMVLIEKQRKSSK